MKIITNYEKFYNEIYNVCHLFYPDEKLNDEEPVITHKMTINKNLITNDYTIKNKDDIFSLCEQKVLKQTNDTLEDRRQLKRFAKLTLYKLFSTHFNKNMPWGSLTGIRPTKIGYDLIKQGVDPYMLTEALMENFLVSREKAMLVSSVIRNQKCIIRNDKLIDLYINIPFCPTRCNYCSFISSEIDKVRDLMPKYLECLIKEINATKEIINDCAYIVRTIYIGGGTPTGLSANELDLLLGNINYPVNEFTVECGRPDTITEDKLKVLKEHNVTRISINPQTFCDATLKRIGRKHTVKDVIEAYKIALKYDFNVNMDLIAGLTGEPFRTFKKSIQTVLELAPDNITVHTLSKKNGSIVTINNEENTNDVEIEEMITYSTTTLQQNGYKPYYLYRQKNQLAEQENVGYFREKPCIFNIDSMEETTSILACGANAISKRVYSIDNRIERLANVKDIREYINKIDELIAKKRELFCRKN